MSIKTQLCDSGRGRERERGRKSVFLHWRWRGDAPPRVIKTMKTQQRVTDRGLFALAAGTARCLSVWPVAWFPQSSGIFQASPISTNKPMGLFSLSHQRFGLSTVCSIGPKPPCCHLNACSKDLSSLVYVTPTALDVQSCSQTSAESKKHLALALLHCSQLLFIFPSLIWNE